MDVVPILLVANVFLGIYFNQSIWYKLSGQTKFGAYIAIGGGVITVAVNVIFIPIYGFYASAWATLLAYGTMMFISYQMGQKKYPIPYEKKKIATYLVLSIILSFVSFYVDILRETYVFGIVAIVFFTYFVYRNEKLLFAKILKRN